MKLRFFELAKKISQKSPSRHKLGCVIVNKSKIVTFGFNDMNKTHPKIPSKWHTLHAELHALIGLDYKETKGCSIYIYRETKDGKIANAKPCQMCEKALSIAGIKKVFYTHEHGFKVLKL